MAKRHSHKWLTQYYCFPDEEDVYEHEGPYEVQYCADRECGQRRTVEITFEEAEKVRGFNETGA